MEKIECPLCSCVIRRQKKTTQEFFDRFVNHVLHYHRFHRASSHVGERLNSTNSAKYENHWVCLACVEDAIRWEEE